MIGSAHSSLPQSRTVSYGSGRVCSPVPSESRSSGAPPASAYANTAGLTANTPPSTSVRSPSLTGSKYVGAAAACAASTIDTPSRSSRASRAWRS